MTRPRVPRKTTPPSSQPFAETTGPNATWCIDFKGHFQTGDGTTCYPLTVMDAFSRKLLCCKALRDPNGESVRRELEKIFRRYGLPAALRSDNGSPFASTGPGGLTELSAWWTRIGVRHERIAPGKPQQNGRHERMHWTLKQETAMPPAATLAAQQEAFDQFMAVYNRERPHEALDGLSPDDVYRSSTRRLRRRTCAFEYPADAEIRNVRRDGTVLLGRRHVRVGMALVGENVAFRWVCAQQWEASYGPVSLGIYDLRRGRFIGRGAWAKTGRKVQEKVVA